MSDENKYGWVPILTVIAIVILMVLDERQKSQPIEVKTITITNYVSLPAEFGPDGYGFRHLSQKDSELVRECLLNQGGSGFEMSTFFEDLEVIKTVTHEPMPVQEIMTLLSKNPAVADVFCRTDAKRSFFSLSTLAYPQYEYEYRLTKTQWKTLQDYCRICLIDPIAVKEVVAHWQSITNGVVPFGLKVME